MSTQFVLHALDEGDLDGARAQMAGSLGYGNTDFASIHDAAKRNQEALMKDPNAAYAVYDTASIVVMNEHISLHEEDETCLAHALVAVIGHDLPVLDWKLMNRILDVVKQSGAPPAETVGLGGWLKGARGRRLWYVFA